MITPKQLLLVSIALSSKNVQTAHSFSSSSVPVSLRSTRVGTRSDESLGKSSPLNSKITESESISAAVTKQPVDNVADSRSGLLLDASSIQQDVDMKVSEDMITNSNIQGTQSQTSASINLGKCICGAGSFALPHVFLTEGVLGGTIAMSVCALLASLTMQSLNDSRSLLPEIDQNNTPSTYVELAQRSLGSNASKLVFTLTIAASLGVCSTYIVFIGQILASLSEDAVSNNIVHTLAPNVSQFNWEVATVLTLLPLTLVRNYGIFAFTSALGVTAVLGGIITTLAYGLVVDPGGGIETALSSIQSLKMWPDSIQDAFGGSFGTIAYLFCVNFGTFPIINSMKDAKNEYNGAVSNAVTIIWIVNIIFAVVCLGFYGDNTQDLVLANLDNGPYLSALKLFLCVDLIFTFPLVFASGRQLLENALLEPDEGSDGDDDKVAQRAAITGGLLATCFGLSQVGGFGVVANLVGGVAQGTMAFIVPPAIAISLSRRANNDQIVASNEVPQWAVASFGALVVSSVTYFTLAEAIKG